MKKLNLFLVVFIFVIQLQAQNSIFIGERAYYLPEMPNGILDKEPIFVRYIPTNPIPIATNLSIGYKRDIGKRYFIDFMLDRFHIGEYYSKTLDLYPPLEYTVGGFKQFQLQGGYYLIQSKYHQLGISTGVLYRKGGVTVHHGYRPNPNWAELNLQHIHLRGAGIPLDIEYSFYPIKWFSLSIEAGGAVYFKKDVVYTGVEIPGVVEYGEPVIYDDFKWNLYLGLRAGFHFGDPKFKFLKKKKK